MADLDRRWVITREVDLEGAPLLEGLVVSWAVDPTLPWEQLDCVSVDTFGILLDHRGGVSARHDVDTMLEQFGWERSHGARGPHHFPIRRSTPRFLAQRVSERVVVSTVAGVRVAEYDASSEADGAVLEENGWLITNGDGDRAPGLPMSVLPFDWSRVVQFVSQARKSAQALAEQADFGWREVIREGLLAGHDAKKLADLTGVTPQRIYQVRDGRR